MVIAPARTGSASMRTGGDDIAQAFALLGVRPLWDHASNRVSGYEILPLAMLGRARVDVTLRVSGLFRDVFPAQIALLHRAIQDVAALDESLDDNPLTAHAGPDVPRIFGAAPGRYGVGIARLLAAGEWTDRRELAAAYLAAASHAYDGEGEGREQREAFGACVAAADAFVHVQDLAGQDVLNSDAFAEHEGGFAAAAQMLGGTPELYHVDTTRPNNGVVRPLAQEIARVLRGRAVNPRWIAGQMRHGHRGAAEIAETLDNLFAYAALTDAAPSRYFDLLFEATCGDERVRAFLVAANPQAAAGMAERFEEARRRGLWVARRNSSVEFLTRCGGPPHECARRAARGSLSRRARANANRRWSAGAPSRVRQAAEPRMRRGDRRLRGAVRQWRDRIVLARQFAVARRPRGGPAGIAAPLERA